MRTYSFLVGAALSLSMAIVSSNTFGADDHGHSHDAPARTSRCGAAAVCGNV